MNWLEQMSAVFIGLLAESAPWLVLGFVVAAAIKCWLPSSWVKQQLAGRGLWPIVKGALIGAPVPLCSCGVIPAAAGIRRAGASRSATCAFLVATPETGVDSIAMSYGLLGPVMAVVRPVAAIFSAIATGIMVALGDKGTADGGITKIVAACEPSGTSRQGGLAPRGPAAADGAACCSGHSHSHSHSHTAKVNPLRFISDELYPDLVNSLLVGLVVAAVVQTLVPPTWIAANTSTLGAMLLSLLISIPVYVCATASTPIAVGMLAAGVSPGTALIFMLAGPATNLATILMVDREMGRRTAVTYVAGVMLSALGSGLLLDWLWQPVGLNWLPSLVDDHHGWLTGISMVILALLTLYAYGLKFRVWRPAAA